MTMEHQPTSDEVLSNASSGTDTPQSSSAPSSSTLSGGKISLFEHLRSISMSRPAFSLFHGFNPCAEHFFYLNEILLDNRPHSPPPVNFTNPNEHRDCLLQCIPTSVKPPKEQTVTENLVAKLDKIGRSCSSSLFFAHGEVTIPGSDVPNSSDGRADVILYSRSPKEEDKGDLLGIIEVGRGSNLDKVFWQKVGQLNKYLSCLSTNVNVKINRAKETQEKSPRNESTARPDAVKKPTRTTSLPPKAATPPAPKMMEIEMERFSNNSCPVLLAAVLVTDEHWNKGRFAVFVCEKKRPISWRMALLWRKELSSRVELSSVFGYYINAIKFLATAAVNPESEETKQLKVPEEGWDYLGPNCSKITFRDTNNEVRTNLLLNLSP